MTRKKAMTPKTNRLVGARSRRGGAMVELVVLMLVFVPLILLPMYFQDALRYKLDYQEAVSSAAWDFAFQNYEDDKINEVSGAVESSNREIYSNLWSGNNRSKGNPSGPWANFSWKDQIECNGEKGFGSCYTFLSSTYHDKYTRGGLVSCKGKISVSNHYVPRQFLQEFADQELFDHGTDALVYPEYRFGMLVDPWCVTGCDGGKCPMEKGQSGDFDVKENGKGEHPGKEFYKRVNTMWKSGFAKVSYAYFVVRWTDFIKELITKKVGSPALAAAYVGCGKPFDNPLQLKLTSLHLANKEQSVPVAGGRSSFYVSPYKDGDDNMYEKTYNERKSYYLGCDTFGPYCK